MKIRPIKRVLHEETEGYFDPRTSGKSNRSAENLTQ